MSAPHASPSHIARLRKAFAAAPDGFKSATLAVKAAGGDTGSGFAAFRALVEGGEVVKRDGRYYLAGPAPSPSPKRGQAPPAEPPDVELPGSTATVAGLAEILDAEIRETRLHLRTLRKAAAKGEAAPGLAVATRTVSELIRRRRELVADHDADTLLPDAELERRILECGQLIVAGAVGEKDPARIAFAVVDADGGHRLIPLAKVVGELHRRHVAEPG